MPRPKSLHTVILEAALAGLEFQRQRVNEQIAQVRSLLRPAPRKRAAQAPAKPRPRMSLAGRKRIAAAQRRRWAEFKKKSLQGK